MENKLGITFDRVRTNQHSLTSLNAKLTPEELSVIQGQVDKIYTQFLTRVSEGRKMKLDKVAVLARGRVWSGEDAVRIGLVDELGGLSKAIAFACKGQSAPKVIYYPIVKKNALSEITEMIEQQQDEEEQELHRFLKNSEDFKRGFASFTKGTVNTGKLESWDITIKTSRQIEDKDNTAIKEPIYYIIDPQTIS
jgi:ClpP class serine protease